MLVLSRKRDEVVNIGDDLTVTVIEIRGDKVRLGFNGPKDVPIHRHEVWLAIQKANAEIQAQEGSKSNVDVDPNSS